MSRPLALNGLILLLSLLPACGGGTSSPTDQMAAADQAQIGGDHQKAIELYDGLQSWSGEGTVSDDQKFKAALEAVKCQVLMGQADQALDRYKKMFESHAGTMGDPSSYKHTLTVLNTMMGAKADTMVAIDLLGVAKEKHPAHEEAFQKWVEKLKKMGLGGEELEKLKEMGYL